MKRACLMILLSLLAPGCASVASLRPVVVRPAAAGAEQTLPNRFVETADLLSRGLPGDPSLQALLNQVPQSPDSEIAQSRLMEANAQLRASRASLWPSIGGTSTVTASGSDGNKSSNSLILGSNLQVPVDLFGNSRDRVSAQAIRVEEARFNQARTKALTEATLRQLYVAMRVAQAQIVVTRANLDSANDSLSLANARRAAGLETGLGVAQATNNRDATAARLPAYGQSEAAAKLGIEALLGKLPGQLAPTFSTSGAVPNFDLKNTNIPPSQWFLGRADLMAAQRRMQAAGLEANAATKDRLPSLSLNTLISNTSASSGFTGFSGSASLNLVSTLFDFGRLDGLAQFAGAQAQTQAGLYKQAVLNAVADVEVQASRTSRALETLDAQTAAVASAQDQARLARVRYTSGLSDFLVVLTAQKAVYEAQSAQVLVQGEIAASQAALILALGL
jgi:outer membrane protein, multidrug efflux system